MIDTYYDLKRAIRDGFEDVVDEFVDKLTPDERRKLCACGWNYITFADKWDDFYDTDAYKKFTKELRRDMNISHVFKVVKEEPEVRDWMYEHYRLDIDDTEALKDDYPKGYMRGVVWDVIYWIGEYDLDYGISDPLYEKIDELKENFWDDEYDRVAEGIGLAEANRSIVKNHPELEGVLK